jgi:hypothetical protein
MTNEQMELGFGGTARLKVLSRKQQRAPRASWWFERMRAVVDSAFDWSATPQPTPEQIWLPDARRQVQF